MPKILPSSSIRNRYNELSEFCNNNQEAIFITKNGEGDLAVMSINHYEAMSGKLELLGELMKGLHDIAEGKVRDIDDVFQELENE